MKKNLIFDKKNRKRLYNKDPGEINNNGPPNSFQDYKILKKKKINKKNKNPSSQMPKFLKTESNDFNRYVKKSYKKCLNQNEVNFMTTQLEKIYTNAEKIGDFNLRNWKLTPLPILTREKMNKLSLALNSSQCLTFHSGKMPNRIPTNNFLNNSHYYQTNDHNQFKNNNLYNHNQFKNNNNPYDHHNQFKNHNKNIYEQNQFKNNNKTIYDQNLLKNNNKNIFDHNQIKNNNLYNHNQFKNNTNPYDYNQFKNNNRNVPFNNNNQFKNNFNNQVYNNNQLKNNTNKKVNYPTFLFSTKKNMIKTDNPITPPPMLQNLDSNFFDKIKKKDNKKKNIEKLPKKKFEKGNIKEKKKRFLVPTVVENKTSGKKKKLIGTCQKLEKEYFRVTMEPNASEIRPLEILKKSLKLILTNYSLKKKDHNYLLDQLRSIRQDLLIQDIKNNFVVEVYEKNSIFAIKYKDYLHFSKCLSNLIDLYNLGFKGKNNEFYLYQLISLCLKNGSSELQSFILSVPENFYYSEEFFLGKEILESLQNDNYLFIFEKMINSKFLGLRFLLSYYKEILRFWAFDIISHSQGKKRKYDDLVRELCFENKEEFFKFLKDNKINFDRNKGILELKENREVFEELNQKVFNLF